MGEAKRKALAQQQRPVSIKIPPRKRQAGFLFIHYDRIEEQGPDGRIFARNLFAPVDADGNIMVEETPDGPRTVVVSSVLQPVRRSVLTKV